MPPDGFFFKILWLETLRGVFDLEEFDFDGLEAVQRLHTPPKRAKSWGRFQWGRPPPMKTHEKAP